MNLFGVNFPEDEFRIGGSFTPSRLTLARMRRGMKQEDLAAAIAVDAWTVGRYEKGQRVPDASLLVDIADRLRYPVSFFSQDDIGAITLDGVSFRARRSDVKARTREKTLASLVMASRVVAPNISRMFTLPACDVPSITDVPPHVAADRLRSEWKLGPYPIPNMFHLLEAKGVRIYWIDETDESVDAVSAIAESVPFALLSCRKRGGERMRFDLAHELGHLVMHRCNQDLSVARMESDANAFAAAFLMPESRFRTECPKNPTIVQLLNLKPRWRVSLAALVHRCFDLGIYTESQYRAAFRKIGASNWRKHEPDELPAESSRIWELILKHFSDTHVPMSQLAQRMHLYEDELWNLIPLPANYLCRDVNVRPEDHFVGIHELGYPMKDPE